MPSRKPPYSPLASGGRRSHATWLRTDLGKRVVTLGFLATSSMSALVRYLRIRLGSAAPHHDVQTTWRPISETVAAGTPLYTGEAIDNKPPLFEYLNLVVAVTDRYLLVFLLLVAVANAAIAVALWRFHARKERHLCGLLAGIFFLATVPLVHAHAINVRSFSLVAVLGAFAFSGPIKSGSALAVAGLFSQYSYLAIPVILHDHISEEENRHQIRLSGRFIGALVCGVGVGYASVSFIWGWQSLTGALYWSLGFARTYVFVWGPSLWTNPGTWLAMHMSVAVWLTPLLALASVGALTVARKARSSSNTRLWGSRELSLCLVFAIPLLIRSLPTYWLYPLPWLASLGALGTLTLIRSVTPIS